MTSTEPDGTTWPVYDSDDPSEAETVTGPVLDADPSDAELVDVRHTPAPIHPRLRLQVALIHTRRVPIYWLRVIARSPHGAARIARSVNTWSRDESGASRLDALADTKSYYKAVRRHDANTAYRRRLASVVATESALGAAAGILIVWPALTPFNVAAVILGVLTLLGFIGRDRYVPIVSRVITSDSSAPISTDLIMRALGSIGIAELNKALSQASRAGHPDTALGWAAPIREEGAGWRADVDLPHGVTAAEVVAKRNRLASGLRRHLSAVWPESDPDAHAGRLILYVSHKPMAQMRQGSWPLAARGEVNLFDPFPLGVDPRGNVRPITLMFVAMVVGAIPRMGKTFAARLCLLAAALDPFAELHIFDAKGGADWLPLAPVAHRFRSIADPEDMDYLSRDVDELQADMVRRYKTLRRLPREACPEGKVTPELARDRALGLHPVVLMLDECQLAFTDSKWGENIEAKIEDLVKRGPAAGIIVILATQKPDASALPTNIRSNLMLRLCMKVTDSTANNMVLGDGAYGAGVNATLFARSEKGVGWLAGEGDDPVIVRSYKIDGPEAERVVARARAARIANNTLGGYAAGQDQEDTEQDTATILDHLAEVWPARDGERIPRVWWEDLTSALAERYPLYRGTSPKAISATCAAHGLESVQVKGKKLDEGNNVTTFNRRGAAYDNLLAALAGRTTDQDEEAQ